jgi:hypothetical protein
MGCNPSPHELEGIYDITNSYHQDMRRFSTRHIDSGGWYISCLRRDGTQYILLLQNIDSTQSLKIKLFRRLRRIFLLSDANHRGFSPIHNNPEPIPFD